MVIGFSDNWLTDIDQPSNSQPKFLIHAFFAFSWFTILVVQNGFIRKGNVASHMKAGKIGFLIYVGLLLSTLPLYLKELEPLSIMVLSQLIFGSVLIGLAYYNRSRNTKEHKFNVMLGSFLLIQPAWDRASDKLFGGAGLEWIVFFLLIYGLFIWHEKRIKWQIAVGFLVWLAGLVNVIMNMS